MPASAQRNPRGGLLRSAGLLRRGLLRGGLLATGWAQSLYQKLFSLGEQLIIASEADASDRPVQEGHCLTFNGTTHHITAPHLVGTETVISSQGTSAPTVSAGRIDFTAGTCNGLILSDGTQYNLDHASGTVAYDSSGNGNHGTLVNGPTWTTDETLPYSWLNQVGYYDDSGTFIPADLSNPGFATNGLALTWAGSAFPRRPVYRDSYLSTWNGTTEYLSAAHLVGTETVTSSVGTSTPTISAGRIDFTAGTCSALVISDGTIYNFAEGVGAAIHDIAGTNHGTIVNASTATEGAGFWAGRIDGEDNAHNANNGFSKRMLFDGVDDEVVFSTSATEFDFGAADFEIEAEVYINDITPATNIICAKYYTLGSARNFIFGLAAGGALQLLTSPDGIVVPFARTDDPLLPNTHYKVKVVKSGTSAAFYVDDVLWSSSGSAAATLNSVDTAFRIGNYQNGAFFDGVIYGVSIKKAGVDVFSVAGNGNTDADWTDQIGSNDGTVVGSPALLRVPASSTTPALDVYGSTLTNPPILDGYNDAETTLDGYKIGVGDTVVPETDGLANFEVITFDQTNSALAALAPVNTAFRRDVTPVRKDRLTIFEDTLTGEDLYLAHEHTK